MFSILETTRLIEAFHEFSSFFVHAEPNESLTAFLIAERNPLYKAAIAP